MQANHKKYIIVVGFLLAVIAVLHLVRLVYVWPVAIGGLEIPMWASWLAVLVAGALALYGFNLSRKN